MSNYSFFAHFFLSNCENSEILPSLFTFLLANTCCVKISAGKIVNKRNKKNKNVKIIHSLILFGTPDRNASITNGISQEPLQ